LKYASKLEITKQISKKVIFKYQGIKAIDVDTPESS